MSWSLGTAGQSGLFDISGGVLTFKDSPDFEDPPEVVTENEYMVTIMATDETNKVATEVVTVKVTNVDEAGTVTLSALRPQSSIAFTAMLSDKDRGVRNAMWQWSKSRSRNGSYANIDDKAMLATYIPKDDDEGYFLKATAMYTDGHGSGKEASERSTYTSQRVRGVNSAPEFDDDQDPVTAGPQADAVREVPENSDSGTFVGGPVTATDDNDDTLTYTLWDMETGGTVGHSASFSIDWATGQIKTKMDLDAETMATYVVFVRATDPAGIPKATSPESANSGTVMVTITVTDVDEVPVIDGDGAVSFNETTVNIETTLGNGAYMATDHDVGVTGDGETKEVKIATWATAGPDGSKFTVTGGELKFKARPDYEKPTDANKDNVYEVTVTVADERGERGMMKVKVTVENANEDGVVTLSQTQPRVGIPITASLSDPDLSLTAVTWQWSNGGDNGVDIEGATTDTYKPVARRRWANPDGDGEVLRRTPCARRR